MFIKVIRTTHLGETKTTLLNKDLIVSVKEKTLEPIDLYDEFGNVVETKQQPTMYKVIMKGGEYYNLDATEYAKLEKELLK